MQEKKYSDRLIEALRKYYNRMIESSQVIAEMIAMAKDMQAALKRDEDLGLTPPRNRLLRCPRGKARGVTDHERSR